MAVYKHQIKPTIIVVIEETVAPAQKRHRDLADSRLHRYFVESAFTFIAEEQLALILEVANCEIEEAVIHVVADGNAHCRYFAAVFIEPEAGGVACVLERAITTIQIEVAQGGVIRDHEVRLAVVVYVC